MENKSFSSRRSYSNNASLFTFIADFKIPLYNKDYYKFLPHWGQYIFGLHQMIFAFVDQNQQHFVLNLIPEPREQ